MKKNWPYVAAGVGAVTILAVAGYAGWQSRASSAKLEEAYTEGNTKSYYGTLKMAQKGELPIQNSNNSSLA